MQNFSVHNKYMAALAAAVLLLSGCQRPPAGTSSGPLPTTGNGSRGGVSIAARVAEKQAQSQVIDAQENHLKKVEVEFPAQVVRLLPDDTKGLPHQRFLVELSNGTRILVAHDTKLAPPVPVSEGSTVLLHGEYIWNDKGGVIHWTHHSPNGRHEPGFIEFNGQRYQ